MEFGKDEVKSFRYPGGEVLLTGTLEQIEERLTKKGFNENTIGQIMTQLFGAISAETSISATEVIEGFLEFVRSEVGE